MPSFSNKYRREFQEKLKNESFDLLVIGGGITGAGIALDAASRGLKVALVEQNDFASGTSSKSTKLIHGGLRYLKQFDLFLVHEVGSERAILHELAPHLVVPDKMILPIIENGTYGSFLTSIGLKIYDLLANVEGDDKRKMLDKETTLQLEPLLPEAILEGCGYYAEYRTDDARLTLEVLKTAFREGAMALNYTEVTSLTYHHDIVKGAMVFDKLLQEEYPLKASYVVNATGPWVDDVRESMDPRANRLKRLQLTKGVHLVFPHEKLPVNQSVYFDVSDGRMIFAIPRHGITYVGTTDTKFSEEPEFVDVKKEDAMYLINAVNNMFPEIELKLDDILSSWAGLRPLIWEEGKSANELSRKDEIFESDSGLISIAGGKLTGYRKMAERVVDLVTNRAKKDYGIKFGPIQTETLKLNESAFKNYDEVKLYVQQKLPLWEKYDIPLKTVKSLVHRYGKQTELIFELFKHSEEKDPQIRLGIAELQYGMEYEMVAKPLDFIERRSGKLYFDPVDLDLLITPLLNVFSQVFNWDQNRHQIEKELLEKAIQTSKTFT